ncbi:MAG: hypothetical protein LLG14_27555 [Nocardiaceae bacterium]|nr:hypothetical protein [Nocardiaceae bacterium]
MKIGQLVMLVNREPGMPRTGSVGEIVGRYEGDYEVEFPGHPCDAGPGTDWLCAPEWLVPIDPGGRSLEVYRPSKDDICA